MVNQIHPSHQNPLRFKIGGGNTRDKNSFIDTPDLQIPHPGALLRKFVLIPLSELASDEIFPKTNIKIVDLLEKCTDTSVVKKYIIDKKA